jgi:hypothetical protein
MHTSDETQKSNFFRRWVIFLLEAKLQEQCPTRCALFSVLRNWKVSSHSAKKPRISDQTGHGADKLSSSWGNSWWIKFRGCFFSYHSPTQQPGWCANNTSISCGGPRRSMASMVTGAVILPLFTKGSPYQHKGSCGSKWVSQRCMKPLHSATWWSWKGWKGAKFTPQTSPPLGVTQGVSI